MKQSILPFYERVLAQRLHDEREGKVVAYNPRTKICSVMYDDRNCEAFHVSKLRAVPKPQPIQPVIDIPPSFVFRCLNWITKG